MKRPGPLPPQPPKEEPEWEDAGQDDDEPRRSRLADLVPFRHRRGRDDDDDVSDDVDDVIGAEDDREKDDAPAESPSDEERDEPDFAVTGPFALWRSAWRRRRAEMREVRRFTARARRRRRTWIGSIAAVALLAAGTVGAAYSPLFEVQKIEVEGTVAVDPAAIEEALSSQLGRPLPRVDHEQIRTALLGFARIESYAVEARPPHGLAVRIAEREPVAVFDTNAGFTTVDAAGVVLSTDGERPEGLPRADVHDGPDSEAFAAVGQVLRLLPETLVDRIASVSADSAESIEFELSVGDGVRVVWGGPVDTAEKVAVLEAGMQANPPENTEVYDVSSSGVLVVR